ncbi:MAG: DNA recombination protein RmuC [Roseivirga sp.]|nr:DNA recombination protein RmuC [Roseivirga sp.]
MEIFWPAGGLISGVLIAWFLAKGIYSKKLQANQKTADFDKAQFMLERERKEMLEQEVSVLKPELSQEREKVLDLSNQLTRVQTEYKSLKARLTGQEEEIEKLNKRFAVEFKNLANEILEEKSQKFTAQNQKNLDQLLTPLKEKIGEFQKKVEDTNKEDVARGASLAQQIKQLGDLNKDITREAQNLTRALKGDTKAQGNWGEVILERILEKSGLEKGREYEVQVSEVSREGKRFQPDVIIRLPEDKNIIIDSKVSLVAYDRYVNGESEEDRLIQLKLHINSIRNHIKGLGEKSYQNLYGIDGLDFVLLFIPIEPAFALAVQQDSELFSHAYAKNIVIVSPTTLIATLRTIASIWKQEYQNKNAIEIARQSGALYDKFVAFTDDLKNIGKHLDVAQKSYSEAEKRLLTGKDNLIRKTEKLKQLGAKASKQLGKDFLDQS